MPRVTRFSGYSQGASSLPSQPQEKAQDTREMPQTQGKRVMELQQFVDSRELGERPCPFSASSSIPPPPFLRKGQNLPREGQGFA